MKHKDVNANKETGHKTNTNIQQNRERVPTSCMTLLMAATQLSAASPLSALIR